MQPIDKAQVVKMLRDFSAFLQIKGENAFKTRAYDLAADRIAGLTEDIHLVVAEKRLRKLQNIGESTALKITELLITGTVASLDALKAAYPPGILELLAVPDMGPKKAKTLWEELQVGSIDELEKACKEQRVRGLKGFGQKTEEKLLAGVDMARRSLSTGSRKLLGDVLPQAEAVLAYVRAGPGVIRASLGGSVRRGKETVADIDIIASAADARAVFDYFLKFPTVGQVIGSGESKTSVRLLDTGMQVDLRVLPDEDFAAALHHFTGSKAHHIRLRGLALDRGLTISEWGVHRLKEEPVEAKRGVSRHETAQEKLRIIEESDIYSLLGMQFVPPELREDQGEIEAALAGTLPGDFITAEDIMGNVHQHSTWSDGVNSLEEMALAAKALGFKYMTVTEHSQTSSYAGGLTLDDLKRQWEEIDGINERIKGITLLKGIESDILEDGRLDYDDSILEKLEVVIGSIHQRYSQDENAMTRRVLNAFDNPHMHIWGHPTGRLINKREPAPMRMDEILDKAAKNGITIEVNGCPERLDLASESIRKALARNIRLVVSTDAHSVGELKRNLRFAVSQARRGWARKGDVLNAQDVMAFKKAIARSA